MFNLQICSIIKFMAGYKLDAPGNNFLDAQHNSGQFISLTVQGPVHAYIFSYGLQCCSLEINIPSCL